MKKIVPFALGRFQPYPGMLRLQRSPAGLASAGGTSALGPDGRGRLGQL